MSNQTIDPFSMWKDYYRHMEKYWGKAMDENMRTEDFSKWMGQLLEGNLFYKEMIDRSSKQYFEQLNLPTREDLANIASMIVNLDAKVDQLEEQFEDNLEAQTPDETIQKDIAALKKDVKKLNRNLDNVLKLMKESQKSSD